jgi:rhamnosyltransferase
MNENNIFIIGSNGIPAKYGGFETFVENLTAKKVDKNIKYHVACLANNNNEFEYNNARCFNVKVPNIGSAKAEYYDLMALEKTIKYIKKNNIENATVYILGTGVGLFIGIYKKRFAKLGVKLYVNPDGCEWKRDKWNFILKKFFKVCEKKMAKHTDLLICDSVNIEKYIKEEYKEYNPNTKFIAYGSDIENTSKNTNKLVKWCIDNKVKRNDYYLIVGRFVPENNYETMIKEFMKAQTKKDLIIITNVEENKFYNELKEKTGFDKDSRIKFVGTVYDKNLLKQIRENAYGYIHGHEVGGTNPSLLEALATTKLNLLLDVGFNKEVAKNSAMYWNKKENNLSILISKLENISDEEKEKYGKLAKNRIEEEYNWSKIVGEYEALFNTK